ncbi:MAG: hypothetical protein JSV26_04945 [bacterium]|nr:MAG: hypothetical protein JSV26_04945 [bacterium]
MDTIATWKRALTLLDILLLAAGGYLLSQLILGLVFQPTPGSAPGLPGTGQVRQVSVTRPGEASNTEVIIGRNLFGSRIDPVATGETTGDVEDVDLPETTLPLQLLGTVANARGEGSFAIIQDTTTREQQIYYPGDTVRDGVILVTVARNRVVLLRNGVEEVLEKLVERVGGPPERRPVPRARPSRAAPEAAEITVRKVADNSYVMDRREVEGVLQDFNKLLTQIRVVPHFADGQPDGFKVFNIRPNSLFMKLGMVNGDIIKRVNGLEITGPEQALQVFQQLKDESNITIDIERFRKNLTLQYEVR